MANTELKTSDQTSELENEGNSETGKLQKKIFLNVMPQIDQKMTLLEIVTKWKPKSWEKVFQDCMEDFEEISRILQEQEQTYGLWFPLKKNLFRAFSLTALQEVKVVLVGQDPYPQYDSNGEPRPTGCSFSVKKDDQIPGSLKNIFLELAQEYPDFQYPHHGCLDTWCRQGVLLLNKCLTVRPNEPGSHESIWDAFLIRVLDAISQVRPKCIYIILGKEAQKIKRYLGEKSIKLEAGHPSGRNVKGGFLGCDIFKKCNDHLIDMGDRPVNWQL